MAPPSITFTLCIGFLTDLKKYFLDNDVKQEFPLASLPGWRGFYERLIRKIKLDLTFEETETEINFVINSRALLFGLFSTWVV